MIIFTSFHFTTNSNQIIDKSPWFVDRFYVVSVYTFVIAINIAIATIPFNPNHKQIPQHMTLEIHVLAWDRHKNVSRVNGLMIYIPDNDMFTCCNFY
jgi:hypothetical protein